MEGKPISQAVEKSVWFFWDWFAKYFLQYLFWATNFHDSYDQMKQIAPFPAETNKLTLALFQNAS